MPHDLQLLQVVLVALVQGLTEFLPISSSAHLILLPRLVGWYDQGLSFDIATHAGSLVAVLAYFRREVVELFRAVPDLADAKEREPGRPAHLLLCLAVGTVPVALGGYLLQDWVAGGAREPILIAATSIGFGLLLGWADWRGRRVRDLAGLTMTAAGVIGLFQTLALIPGTSRSGITITAALLLSYTRPAAARFSFLLSIPVGLLVTGKDAFDLLAAPAGTVDWLAVLIGFAVAALSAYAVIVWFLAWLERRSLQVFVVYRVALGILLLFWFGW